MHCANCRCEYPDWLRTYPACSAPLAHSSPIEPAQIPHFEYGELVDRVATAAGGLEVQLSTTCVGMDRAWWIIYRGIGQAWAERLSGREGDVAVELKATEVGRHVRSFLIYVGYGFAWTQEMNGTCGDRLELTLVASDVAKKQQARFPCCGYGFAWMRHALLTMRLR
jgi:hypothetical protein